MTAEERAALKARIIETIANTEAEILRREENAKPISPDNAIGRVSRMDAINSRGVAEAGLRTAKRKLSNLKIALTKIDLPSFGNCSHCGNPIRPARLMFMPQSDRCVRCADK